MIRENFIKCKFKLWLHAYYPKEKYEGNISYGPGRRKMIKTKYLNGTFHCFSTSWEELNEGVGQYPIAIVEDIKGHIHEVILDNLKLE